MIKTFCYFVLTDFMKKEKKYHVDAAIHFMFFLGLLHFCLHVVLGLCNNMLSEGFIM